MNRAFNRGGQFGVVKAHFDQAADQVVKWATPCIINTRGVAPLTAVVKARRKRPAFLTTDQQGLWDSLRQGRCRGRDRAGTAFGWRVWDGKQDPVLCRGHGG